MARFQTPFYMRYWKTNYAKLCNKTYELKWKLDKQELLKCFNRQRRCTTKITSPPFSLDKEYKFEVDFYPMGDGEGGKSSIYISLISEHEKPVSVLSHIVLRNSKGEIIVDEESADVYGPTLKGWGFTNFVETSVLGTHVRGAADLEIHVTLLADFDQFVFDQTVINDLLEFAKNDTFNDVTVSIGCKEYKAHRYVLAARSPVFKEMLYDKENCKPLDKIEISNVSAKTVERLLQFINMGTADNLDVESAKELLRTAKTFKMDDLSFKCTYYLISSFDVKNIFDILLFADKFDINILKSHALSYIAKNFKYFTKTTPFEELLEQKSHLLIDILKEVAANFKDNNAGCSQNSEQKNAESSKNPENNNSESSQNPEDKNAGNSENQEIIVKGIMKT